MITANRDEPAGDRVDEQHGRRLSQGNSVEKVQFQSEQIRPSKCGRDNRVKNGHPSILSLSESARRREPGQRSSPNRKIDSPMIAKSVFGSHAATIDGIRPERPSEVVMPNATQ